MSGIGSANLIGITGLINSGKDTVANLIIAWLPRQLRRYSFARPLKEGVKAMFGWTDEDIENRTTKETVDAFWGFSPRKAMQLLGTEYGRNLLRDDIWIKAAERYHLKSQEQSQGTIITDVRFENEATWIRSQPNSILIHVKDPHHVTPAGPVHASEAGVQFVEGDCTINNDKTLGIKALEDLLWTYW